METILSLDVLMGWWKRVVDLFCLFPDDLMTFTPRVKTAGLIIQAGVNIRKANASIADVRESHCEGLRWRGEKN